MTALEGKALLNHGKVIARRYAGRIGPELAEELRAEAVSRALGSPPPDGRMEPWLECIYRNLFVDLWRRGRLATVDIDAVPEPAGAGTPEDDLLRVESRRMVRDGLRRLPRESRQALLCKYYGELDEKTTAERFGIAAATVRTRVHRALAKLRAQLGDLRAFCPPTLVSIMVRLGARTCAAGMAPLLVAALFVVGTSTPTSSPVSAHVTSGAVRTAHSRTIAAPPVQTDTPMPSMQPQPKMHVARKAAPVAPAFAPTPDAEVIKLEDAIVGQPLYPDGIEIFAEPTRIESPCMIEAPPSFVAQIEKMIEEQL